MDNVITVTVFTLLRIKVKYCLNQRNECEYTQTYIFGLTFIITCLFMWLYFRYLERNSMKTWWYYPKTVDNNLIHNMLLLLYVVVVCFPLVGIIQNLFIDKCFFFWLLGWWSYIDWTKPNGKLVITWTDLYIKNIVTCSLEI